MAFVRYKIVKGRKYYYLVRNSRENGKHRQQVLCYLGQHKSLVEAIAYEKDMVSLHLRFAAAHEQEAASTKAYLFEFYGDRFTGKLPSLDEANFEYKRKRWQWWPTPQPHEEDLLESIRNYYNEKDLAKSGRELADEHQAQLDKYLALKSAYG